MGDGMFGKFKALIGVEDVEEEIEEIVPAVKQDTMKLTDRANSFIQPKIERREPLANVVDMAAGVSKKQFKLVVIEPKTFDECPKLVDNLRSNKPVIINLERVENETARKIFDFLSGATYAIDGNVQKVANNIFVFAPQNVDVLSSQSASKQKAEAPVDNNNNNMWKK